MQPPRPSERDDARQPGPVFQAASITQKNRPTQPTRHERHATVHNYTTLQAAAALLRASAAHLDEELCSRRADGRLPTRELVLLVPVVRYVCEQLSAIAAQEGGA
jgi:hypothetical protein